MKLSEASMTTRFISTSNDGVMSLHPVTSTQDGFNTQTVFCRTFSKSDISLGSFKFHLIYPSHNLKYGWSSPYVKYVQTFSLFVYCEWSRTSYLSRMNVDRSCPFFGSATDENQIQVLYSQGKQLKHLPDALFGACFNCLPWLRALFLFHTLRRPRSFSVVIEHR